jgi:hypothetical protein
VGAVAGAIVGAIAGAHIAHESDHGHRHVRHVRYVETVRYVQPAHCEPQAVYYRPARVTYVESYPKYTRTAATAKPAVKKVCRYEKVKNVNTASAARRPVG